METDTSLWEDKSRKLDELIHECLLEESNEQEMLAAHINKPQGLEWVRWLGKLVEKDPPEFDVVPIPDRVDAEQAVEAGEGQEPQQKVIKCSLCLKEFYSLLNHDRHKWRHRDTSYKEKVKQDQVKFADFWQELEKENSLNIVSIQSISQQLKGLLQESLVSVIINFANDFLHGLDKGRLSTTTRVLPHRLLGVVFRAENLPPDLFLEALSIMTEENFLHGTLLPEMQQIVRRHAPRKVDGSDTNNLLALFGFIVEYCMVKAHNDDLEEKACRNSQMLIEEEIEDKHKQSPVPVNKQKPSKSQRRRAKQKQQSQSPITVDSSLQRREDIPVEATTDDQPTSNPVPLSNPLATAYQANLNAEGPQTRGEIRDETTGVSPRRELFKAEGTSSGNKESAENMTRGGCTTERTESATLFPASQEADAPLPVTQTQEILHSTLQFGAISAELYQDSTNQTSHDSSNVSPPDEASSVNRDTRSVGDQANALAEAEIVNGEQVMLNEESSDAASPPNDVHPHTTDAGPADNVSARRLDSYELYAEYIRYLKQRWNVVSSSPECWTLEQFETRFDRPPQ